VESLLCLSRCLAHAAVSRLDTECTRSYWLKGQVWVSGQNGIGGQINHKILLKRFEPCAAETQQTRIAWAACPSTHRRCRPARWLW
jgi:hypothetical protein